MARGSAAMHGEAIDPALGTQSVLGRGASVRGRVHGEGSLRVEGSVEGGVRLSGDLEIDEGGLVTGDVEAASVIVAGQLTGDASVSGSVTIRATARVTGNLGGAEVILEEGAAFAGRIEAEFDMPGELSISEGGAAQPSPGTPGRPAARGHR